MSLLGSSFSTRISRGAVAVLALAFFASLLASLPAFAQTETVLYNFCAQGGCPGLPDGGVIADSEGNLYGVTYAGGIGGTVFKLTPAGELSLLDSFDDSHQGVAPGGKLAFDQQGNVYGTAREGGTNRYLVTAGDGTLFKLSPDGTETDLYNFGADSADGIGPIGGVVIDADGNLYGVTYRGGAYGVGIVFRVSPEGVETILHTFVNNKTDGSYPSAGLIMDSHSNVYGTTESGGLYGGGTVFEVTAHGSYRILHNFAAYPGDASAPEATLTLDSQGNLYGTTGYGGTYGGGAVFKMTPGSNGSWNEIILGSFNRFARQPNNGCWDPTSDVVFDAQGNLYGTTMFGGLWVNGCAYEINSAGELTILHVFGKDHDGAQPFGNVLFYQGNLYGTTYVGGAYANGTVFKITP
jgi:uncharacterized repeat protein (TIGR03803 family)